MNQYGEVSAKDFTCYDKEAYERLCRAIDETPRAGFFGLCLYAGMPKGHALAVQLGGLNFDEKTITIRKEPLKKYGYQRAAIRHADAVYPMTEKAAALLRKRVEELSACGKNSRETYIFADEKGNLPTNGQICSVQDCLCREAHVPATAQRMVNHFNYVHCWDPLLKTEKESAC